MDKLIRKIINITVVALAVVATTAGLYIALKGNEFAVEHQTGLNISFYITYILFFAILAMIVFFVIVQVFSNKKSMVQTLILLAICVVITLFSYWIAPKELSDVAMRIGISENIYKWAGAGLNIVYLVFTGVIVAFLGTFIYTKIKK